MLHSKLWLDALKSAHRQPGLLYIAAFALVFLIFVAGMCCELWPCQAVMSSEAFLS